MHLSRPPTWPSHACRGTALRSLFAVLLAMGCGGHRSDESMSPPAPLPLVPCHLEFLAEEVACGVHEVYENRDTPAGRRIPIHVAVLPPLRRSAEPEPLFIMAGGPGQGARAFAGAMTRHFRQVRRTRAIVLVDLRGTGASYPLECLRGRDEIAALEEGADLFLGSAVDCGEQLDADVRQYTHAAALADLDEVRQRLGYGRINLWGGSWGTRAALLYALSYPDAVRSVILDGAVSLRAEFPRSVARDAQRALDLLLERCRANAECAATFPHPQRELENLLSRLDRGPLTTTMKHPRTAADVHVTFTRDTVAEIIRVGLYNPQDAARLLQVIRLAVEGDFGPLAAQYVHSASMSSDDMALGVTMSTLCSEDIPPLDAADFHADAHGTFLGSAYAGGWRTRCRAWRAGPPIGMDRGAVSLVPALILSGAHDPVTPPSSGEAMGRHFSNHFHLVVPGAAHNASFTGCVPDLIATFLERGTAAPLDTACAPAVPLPPIVLNNAGGRP